MNVDIEANVLVAAGVHFGTKRECSPRPFASGELSPEMQLSRNAARTQDGLVLAQTSFLLLLHRLARAGSTDEECNPCELEAIQCKDVALAAPGDTARFFDRLADIFLELDRKEWKTCLCTLWRQLTSLSSH